MLMHVVAFWLMLMHADKKERGEREETERERGKRGSYFHEHI
jgi:hypothetical protein